MARGAERQGRAVHLAGDGATVPQICACCGGDAARSLRERARGRDLFVPYCDNCLTHASSGFTRDLATLVSSVLLGFTLSFALPLWFEWIPLYLHISVAVIGAALPAVLRYVFKPKRREPHTATHLAAWWGGDGTLCCTLPRFADALARENGVACEEASLREPGPKPWVWLGAAVALGLAPVGFRLNSPLVRIINLTDARIAVSVDGRQLCHVEATSAESTAAGLEVRMPAGRRKLQVTHPDGTEVAAATVDVHAGARHLFAPASSDTCFWVEETFYGRKAAPPKLLPFTGEDRFWRIPEHVDVWFTASPEADDDRRSSGGALVAMRQAPCNRAPEAVRNAVGLATTGD